MKLNHRKKTVKVVRIDKKQRRDNHRGKKYPAGRIQILSRGGRFYRITGV